MRLSGLVLCGLLCCMAASAVAQVADAQQSIDKRIDDLRSRVDTVPSQTNMDAALREQVVDTYREAISSLETARNAREETRRMRTQAEQAPARIRELTDELQQIQTPPASETQR